MVIQKQTAKSILAFALLGAVGFGIGGIVGSVIWGSAATTTIITKDGVEYAVRLSLNLNVGQVFLSLALIGAMGGASLGLGLRNWRKAGVAALVGAVGFSIALIIGAVIQLSLWGKSPPYFAGLFTGAIIGVILGASLGLALRGWKAAGLLALAGAIGFGAMFQAVLNLEFEVSSAKSFGIWGAIAGATLGVALGYLERRKVTKESSPPEP
ncbi:MAG: hypothetical protein Q7R34_06365 [Dehalococcoidia bacterium]|nr:hypothetical protein [Dehalococcoidia bacterium]